MARERKEPDPPAGCPAWLATYGDMITLVLTFFVLLFSMSSIDTAKWKALVINLQGASGIFSIVDNQANVGGTGVEQAPEVPEDEYSDPSDSWAVVAQKVKEAIADFNAGILNNNGGATEGPAAGVDLVVLTIEIDEAQIIIRCQTDIAFDTMSDVIKEEFYGVIDFIMSDIIMPEIEADTISEINILGHADIRPVTNITSRIKNNKELSLFRALAVWNYVNEHFDIPTGMIGAMGYGEERPINGDFGTSEEVWAKNRRVEFVMLRNVEMDKESGATYGQP